MLEAAVFGMCTAIDSNVFLSGFALKENNTP